MLKRIIYTCCTHMFDGIYNEDSFVYILMQIKKSEEDVTSKLRKLHFTIAYQRLYCEKLRLALDELYTEYPLGDIFMLVARVK